MGKWANKTCFICGVRRPIFRMKQEIITKKTGHIGFGLSFNPARKKSARIQLPRNRYSKTTKWICKDKQAHGKPDYYDIIERKRLQELERQRIQKEKDERRKRITGSINKTLNSFIKKFDKNEYKNSLFADSEFNDLIDENTTFPIDKNNEINLNIKEFSKEYVNLIYDSSDHTKISSPKNLKKLILNYTQNYIPNIKNILRNKEIIRYSGWYLLIIFIILRIFGYGYDENSINHTLAFYLLFLSIASIILLTPYSFLYKRNESKKFKKISSSYYNISSFISEDFKIKYYDNFVNTFKNGLNTFSKDFNEDPEVVKNILLNLISRTSLDPIGGSKLVKNNKLNNNSKKTTKNNISKFCKFIYYSDNFFEISVAILSFYLSKSDGFLSNEERSFINSYGDLNKKERSLVDDIWNGKHSYINDEIIVKLFQKKYKNNREIYLSLIDNLFAIAESDRDITKDEINFIEKISKKFEINNDEFKKILNNKLDNIKNNKKSDRSLIDDEDFDEIDEFLEELEDFE